MGNAAPARKLEKAKRARVVLLSHDPKPAFSPLDQQATTGCEGRHHRVSDLGNRGDQVLHPILWHADGPTDLDDDARKERFLPHQHAELTDEIPGVDAHDRAVACPIHDLDRAFLDVEEVVALLSHIEQHVTLV